MTVRDLYIYCLAFGLEDKKLVVYEYDPSGKTEIRIKRDNITTENDNVCLYEFRSE